MAGRFVRRQKCFGSAHDETCEGSSTSCFLLRRCAVCLPVPWLATLCGGLTILDRRTSRPATAAAHATVSCGDMRRAYRRIGWPPDATALLLWLCAGRGPRRQQHELLTASAVRHVNSSIQITTCSWVGPRRSRLFDYVGGRAPGRALPDAGRHQAAGDQMPPAIKCTRAPANLALSICNLANM